MARSTTSRTTSSTRSTRARGASRGRAPRALLVPATGGAPPRAGRGRLGDCRRRVVGDGRGPAVGGGRRPGSSSRAASTRSGRSSCTTRRTCRCAASPARARPGGACEGYPLADDARRHALPPPAAPRDSGMPTDPYFKPGVEERPALYALERAARPRVDAVLVGARLGSAGAWAIPGLQRLRARLPAGPLGRGRLREPRGAGVRACRAGQACSSSGADGGGRSWRPPRSLSASSSRPCRGGVWPRGACCRSTATPNTDRRLETTLATTRDHHSAAGSRGCWLPGHRLPRRAPPPPAGGLRAPPSAAGLVPGQPARLPRSRDDLGGGSRALPVSARTFPLGPRAARGQRGHLPAVPGGTRVGGAAGEPGAGSRLLRPPTPAPRARPSPGDGHHLAGAGARRRPRIGSVIVRDGWLDGDAGPRTGYLVSARTSRVSWRARARRMLPRGARHLARTTGAEVFTTVIFDDNEVARKVLSGRGAERRGQPD